MVWVKHFEHPFAYFESSQSAGFFHQQLVKEDVDLAATHEAAANLRRFHTQQTCERRVGELDAPIRPAGMVPLMAAFWSSVRASVMAVSMNPGATQLTVIARLASSWATDLEAAMMPALEAA